VPDPSAPDDLSPPAGATGRLVGGRYELTRRIASGGMAEVWEARDQVLERHVAVKLLHRHLAADAVFTQRFRGEAVAAARLHHHAIVSIYDTSSDDGVEAIVMELVRGRTLRDYLDERGRLDPIEVVHIGADVADALSAAHRAHIVHRDIKPANILLCDDERVMVTDFGIAKVRDDSDLTNTGTMLGTVKYLAPEQVEGHPVDGRTDIYALGVVMYEMLTGRPPFDADTAAATALARLHQTPTSVRQLRPEVPPPLDAIVMRALAKQPADRFQSAVDLRAALRSPRALAPLPPPARDPDATTVTHADRTAVGAAPPVAPWPTQAAASPVAVPVAASTAPSRRWVIPLLMVLLIGASIGLAVALLARTQDTGSLVDGPTGGGGSSGDQVVRIEGIASFDPAPGDGNEHDGEIAFTIDGDESTVWTTEGYRSADFGGLKDGVGIYVTLNSSAALRDLKVRSSSTGWAAQVYVADQPASSLQGWGAPVGERSDIDGDVTFDLDGAEGKAVLLWITRLPGSPSVVEISEMTLTT
jgi:serine/threonine-protein kinase